MMLKMFATLLTLQFIAVSAWAGPAEDEALYEAAHKLNLDAVKAALEKGANPNAVLYPSRTPLRAVALGAYFSHESRIILNGQALEITKILFAKGAKIGVYDKEILYVPIAWGNAQLVSLLLDRGASPTAKDEVYTPTELALKYSQREVYDLLISRGGIPVDKYSAAQLTLVHAAGEGDIAGMERAVKAGADINSGDASGKTALCEALKHRGLDYLSAVLWLLNAGADPNLPNIEIGGDSGLVGKAGLVEGIPLHVFVWSSGHTLDNATLNPERRELIEGILTRLLQAGAKVSGMDSKSRTPLHIAAKYDHLRAAELLIRAGARVMARDNQGKTPLDYAESASMIRLLKKHGATER